MEVTYHNLSMMTDIVFFCGSATDVRFFFPRNVPFQTSVVFSTLHETLLIARGQRSFIVLVFFVFFFAMVSNAVDT